MLESRQNINNTSFRTALLNLTIISVFFFGFFANSQVTSTVDTTQIRIGEEIIYTIQVEADSTDLVLFPEGQTFNPLEVLESYKIDTIRLQDKIKLIKK